MKPRSDRAESRFRPLAAALNAAAPNGEALRVSPYFQLNSRGFPDSLAYLAQSLDEKAIASTKNLYFLSAHHETVNP